MEELKGMGYRLYLLSNANRRLREYLPRIPGSQYLDGLVVSAEEKLLKPQAEIYHVLYDRYDLKPEECVFLDDTQKNLDAAEKFGIHTILFRGMEEAKERLRELGVD